MIEIEPPCRLGETAVSALTQHPGRLHGRPSAQHKEDTVAGYVQTMRSRVVKVWQTHEMPEEDPYDR